MNTADRQKVLDALGLAQLTYAGLNLNGLLITDAINIMRKEPEPVSDEAKEPPQISDAEIWKQAVMLAYGHLWHVNNEPMAPIPMRSPEKAAYAARKVLLDLLTHEERGLAINEVRALLEKHDDR